MLLYLAAVVEITVIVEFLLFFLIGDISVLMVVKDGIHFVVGSIGGLGVPCRVRILEQSLLQVDQLGY